MNIKKERASRGHGPKKCIGKKKWRTKVINVNIGFFSVPRHFFSDDGLIGKVYKIHPYSLIIKINQCHPVCGFCYNSKVMCETCCGAIELFTSLWIRRAIVVTGTY